MDNPFSTALGRIAAHRRIYRLRSSLTRAACPAASIVTTLPCHTARYLFLQLRYIAASNTPGLPDNNLRPRNLQGGKQETFCRGTCSSSKLYGHQFSKPTRIFSINGSQTSGFHSTTFTTLRHEAVAPRSTRTTRVDGQRPCLGLADRRTKAENLTETAYLDDYKERGVGFHAYIGALQLIRRQTVLGTIRILSSVAFLV